MAIIMGVNTKPYGRKKFDTGGSSSGSASSIAANLCSSSSGTKLQDPSFLLQVQILLWV
jgi:Asp-tRNA(Asn)/Glu-tRNA(Gln) amidotransferase A subunit family amidase